MRVSILQLLFAISMAAQPPAIPESKLDQAKNATVMIWQDNSRIAAGIIFAVRGNLIYVVTCAHALVPDVPAKVELRWLPGQPLDADIAVNNDNESAALDMKVLIVKSRDDYQTKEANKIRRPLNIQAEPMDVSGKFAFALGASAGQRWSLSYPLQPMLPGPIIIPFNLSDASFWGGYSGGPLLTTDGLIAGMVGTATGATRMDAILTLLTKWGYPRDLRRPREPLAIIDVPTSDPPVVSGSKLRFFDPSNKIFANKFSQSIANVSFETEPFPDTRGDYKALYTGPGEAETFCRLEKIKPEKTGGFILLRSSCGFSSSWQWQAGKYSVKVFNGAKVLAQGSFEITPTDSEISDLGFFDAPKKQAQRTRRLAKSFNQMSSWIGVQISLNGPAKAASSYTVGLKVLKSDNSIYQSLSWQLAKEAGVTNSRHKTFIGFDTPGKWETGVYRVVVSGSDGQKLLEDTFEITASGSKLTIDGIFLGPSDAKGIPANQELTSAILASTSPQYLWYRASISGPTANKAAEISLSTRWYKTSNPGPNEKWVEIQRVNSSIGRSADATEFRWYQPALPFTWTTGRYKIEMTVPGFGSAEMLFAVADTAARVNLTPPANYPYSLIRSIQFRDIYALGNSATTQFPPEVREIGWTVKTEFFLKGSIKVECKDATGQAISSSSGPIRNGYASGVITQVGSWSPGSYTVSASWLSSQRLASSFTISASAPAYASVFLIGSPILSRKPSLFIDSNEISRIEAFRYFAILSSPGIHKICVEKETKNCVNVTFESGKTHYIQIASGLPKQIASIEYSSVYKQVDPSLYKYASFLIVKNMKLK